MEKIAEMLKGVFYLATLEGDQPRVRAFDYATEYEGKIYFETTVEKDVYRQLVAHPKFELFAMGRFGILRLAGEAYEETDAEVAKAVEKKIGKYLVGGSVAIFRMERVAARINNFGGGEERLEF